jgi:hypothetical protein
VQGFTGVTGAQGVQGNTGATGAQGIQGDTGVAGVVGATGATGTDATGEGSGSGVADCVAASGVTEGSGSGAGAGSAATGAGSAGVGAGAGVTCANALWPGAKTPVTDNAKPPSNPIRIQLKYRCICILLRAQMGAFEQVLQLPSSQSPIQLRARNQSQFGAAVLKARDRLRELEDP